MNKNNSNIPIIQGGLRSVSRTEKSITPAVLGVASSHGVKLPINMTSENQKELLSKLEEWRKARREKLAASILAKQKQIAKPKTQKPILTQKNKSVPVREDGGLKIQNRQSVFERLYKSNGKTKKVEATISYNKPSQISQSNVKKPAVLSFEKPEKPIKVLLVEEKQNKSLNKIIGNENESTALEKISAENPDGKILDDMKAKSQMDVDKLVKISKKNFCEIIKATKPMFYLKSNEVSNDSLKLVKNDIDSKCFVLPRVSSKVAGTEKQKNTIRRSISMIFHQNSKINIGVRRSTSAKNLIEMNLNMQKPYDKSLPIPSLSSNEMEKRTKNEVSTKSVSFVTLKNNRSLTSIDLRTKLEDWLKKNGHSLEKYRHLRCFGISNNYKSIPRTSAFHSEHFFENSHYITAPNTPVEDSDKENMTPPTVLQQVDEKDIENWLNELHRLIVEVKYPSERCEEWLAAIRKKCTNCSQLPIYWECLAALHESKGDMKSAIEDYERAIIKGGEVDAVGNSLAKLFDKMILEEKKNPKRKLEKGLDPKNIFKSTIIKFALQQKALKKLSSEMEPSVQHELYIATPVRRSTRIQTPFKPTEVNSLQTFTPEFLKNVKFKPNESLLSGN